MVASAPERDTKAAPPDAEIVIVDNGSTDNHLSLQWAAASPFRVRLRSEPKAGLSRAQNRALLAAEGGAFGHTDT